MLSVREGEKILLSLHRHWHDYDYDFADANAVSSGWVKPDYTTHTKRGAKRLRVFYSTAGNAKNAEKF